jgi:precorrin-2 C20-methyltransferase/precorrin-3B C17-methyltransferase
LGTPLVEGDQVLTVLPGTLPPAELTRRLAEADAAVVMKLGRTYPGVRQSLSDAGRLDDAYYVERASTGRQRVLRAGEVDASDVPYFAITVVPGPAPTTEIPLTSTNSGQTKSIRTDSAPEVLAAQEDRPEAGEVVVVGLGPGSPEWTSPEVSRALSEATDLVGYTTYIDRVPARPGQRRHASDNRVESERAAMALDLARHGARAAVVSSGDPGVFAMAAAVIEESADPQWRDVPVRVLPGMTAASAVASRVGAPLGHDFAMISLSDRLKPWETVAQRISAVAAADMAIAVYNPASSQRTWQVAALRDLVLEHRKPDTPVVLGRDVGGPAESVRVLTLADLDPAEVDMRTLLIIGASTTTAFDTAAGRRVFTSRRYATP